MIGLQFRVKREAMGLTQKEAAERLCVGQTMIAQVETGAANKEIAEALKLSDGTVRNYLSTILNKLDLRDRTQLAIWAVQTNASKHVRDEER